MKFCFILFILFFVSCGKFNLSPYLSKVNRQHLNRDNLLKISQREAQFTNNFKVALLSDTHDYYDELDELIDHINSKKEEYAFVIVSGDITNIGLLDEFLISIKILKSLEIPFIVAVGNHDLLTNGRELYEQLFGTDTFSFNFKQTRFNIINNNNWETSTERDNHTWVKNDITANPKTHHVVISHVSMEDPARFTEAEIDEWKTLGNTLGIKYFINGHDHGSGSRAFGNATRVTVGSPSHGGYAELIITDGGITDAFIFP